MKINKSRGFTLIELLVVISIIGLLSSVVLASLSTARAKGRDSQRKQALIQLRTALELFRSDKGYYPATNNTNASGNPADFTIGSYNSGYRAASVVCSTIYGQNNPGTGATGYIPGLVPNYISTLPTDPKGDSNGKCYMYTSNGNDYKILAWNTVEEGIILQGLPWARYPTSCTPPAPLPSWWNSNIYSVYSQGFACY